MKKSTFLSVSTCMLLGLASGVLAVPLGRSNDPMHYMLKAPDLSRLSAGAYYGGFKRIIEPEGWPFDLEMDSQRVMAYLGVDLVEWLNVYLVGGRTEVDLDGLVKSDGGGTFGAGISINLLNHFIREPVTMEDAIRVNLGGHILWNEVDFSPGKLEWVETSAALTVAIVNHPEGIKEYSPESISLYAGPALSFMDSDDFDAKTEVGAVGGLEIFFTDSVMLDLRVEYFDHADFSAGINLRF